MITLLITVFFSYSQHFFFFLSYFGSMDKSSTLFIVLNVSQQWRDEKTRQPTVLKNQYVGIPRLKYLLDGSGSLDRVAFKPRWHDKGLVPRRFVRNNAMSQIFSNFVTFFLYDRFLYYTETVGYDRTAWPDPALPPVS